jgi:hypothetical protein
MRLFLAFVLGLSSSALNGSPVAAQTPLDPTQEIRADEFQTVPIPPHVALVEGEALLHRDGETQTAVAGEPLQEGDRLETRAGRVEVLTGGGSAIYLDEHSSLEWTSPAVVRLRGGRLGLVAASLAGSAERFVIDSDGGSIWATMAGEYYAALDGAAPSLLRLAVVRGAAELVSRGGVASVRAGEQAEVRADQTPSRPTAIQTALWAAFGDWMHERQAERVARAQVPETLPSALYGYANVLADYGSWETAEPYGAVWYPVAASGWSPYSSGRWSHTKAFGWTWIGYDPWAWPTHHFGRWGYGYRGWFWVPGPRWGPAWVQWRAVDGFLAWSALGPHGGPAFDHRGVSHVYRARGFADPWFAWTASPYDHFRRGRHVQPLGFAGGQPPLGGGRSFAQRPGPQPGRGFVGRGPGPRPAPIPRGAILGGVALPRGGGVRFDPPYGAGYGGYGWPYGYGYRPPPEPSPYERAQPYMTRPDAQPAAPGRSLDRDLHLAAPFRSRWDDDASASASRYRDVGGRATAPQGASSAPSTASRRASGGAGESARSGGAGRSSGASRPASARPRGR